MKASNLFAVLSIIALLIISEGATIVHAQTLTQDFGVTNITSLNGSKAYSYDVTVNIQTEPNGDWISGKTYQVGWVITLMYVNQSIFNDFSILFYLPSQWGNSDFTDFTPQIITNETQLSLQQKVGTLNMTFTAGNTPENFQFYVDLMLTVSNNGQVISFDNGEWFQNTPLYINLVYNPNYPSQTNSSSIQPIYVIGMAVSVVIIAIGIGAYAYTRKGKKSLSPPPPT